MGDSRDVFDGVEAATDLAPPWPASRMTHDARHDRPVVKSGEDPHGAGDVSGQVPGQGLALHRALCPTFASYDRTAGVLRRGVRTSAEVGPAA